ncbi:MAG: ABC transporter permease [Erysipelotrichaceae bacterium]|nr:ABC transporter permease [Erysipelotrichaceae bacterium]
MLNPFYFKLALSNIRRNKELFLPYILTWIVTIMMYYILMTITISPELSMVGGGDDMRIILNFGCIIVAFFAIIFLFYTNSFITKRRRKEISLYNILGLGKRHIGFVLFAETIIVAFGSLLVGIFSGFVIGKLTFLLLLKLLHTSIPLTLGFSLTAAMITSVLFFVIFIIVLFFNLFQIFTNNPISLMKEGKAGEREPKTKIIMTIIGFLTLGAGYYIAQAIDNPLEAIGVFFIAVILVMIGTYALFTSGSIAVLKSLKANKKYYYQSRHFSVISGMLYRMKQNAVGLANICILSTMVLVTISTTVSLYVGQEQVINAQYPYDITLTTTNQSAEYNTELLTEVKILAAENNITIDPFIVYNYKQFSGVMKDSKFYLYDQITDFDNYYMLTFIPLDQYNAQNGQSESLTDNEVLVYSADQSFTANQFVFNGKTFVIKSMIAEMNLKNNGTALISSFKEFYVVVKDQAQIAYIYQQARGDDTVSNTDYLIMFNFSGQAADVQHFNELIGGVGDSNTFLKTKDTARTSFYSLYGGLLFIGVFLGSLFLLATALIIYYKQISEGYDDKERYKILKNVGMSDEEVHRSVNSQIKMVFFMPLLIAVIHIVFAFKIITEMLSLFGLMNISLFIGCTIATVAIFMLVYLLIYRLTARTYYRIIG